MPASFPSNQRFGGVNLASIWVQERMKHATVIYHIARKLCHGPEGQSCAIVPRWVDWFGGVEWVLQDRPQVWQTES